MRTLRRFLSLLLVASIVLTATAYGAPGDQDNDGISDSTDNCPATANPDQADRNVNGTGDACDDPDHDGLSDQYELYATYGGNAFRRTDPDKKDTDGDGLSDGYEVNRNYGDAANPRRTDPTLRDTDGDGWEDGTEVYLGTDPTKPDTDGDGVTDPMDNCPTKANANQADTDHDNRGDACDDQNDNGNSVDQTVADAENTLFGLVGTFDIRPYGDLNRMATDGYIIKATQYSPGYFTVQVLNATTLAAVPLALPDTGITYMVNGPVAVFAYTVDDKPSEGERINVKWRYSSRSKNVTIKVLKGTTSHDGGVAFAVPPVGYPTPECRKTVLPGAPNTCDGSALGFYNPLKSTQMSDLLDAVPYETTVAYG
jgi:hypothetical protein